MEVCSRTRRESSASQLLSGSGRLRRRLRRCHIRIRKDQAKIGSSVKSFQAIVKTLELSLNPRAPLKTGEKMPKSSSMCWQDGQTVRWSDSQLARAGDGDG